MSLNHTKTRFSKQGGTGGITQTSGGSSGAASADAHTVGANVYCVRIASGLAPFRFNVGAAATATSPLCPANSEIFVGVNPDDHIHVIQEAAASAYSISDVDA